MVRLLTNAAAADSACVGRIYLVFRIRYCRMTCINCNTCWSGAMSEIMGNECADQLSYGALLRCGILTAQELFNGGRYGDAQWLLGELHPRACQVCGPEHVFTEIIEKALELVDLTLENHRLKLDNHRLKLEVQKLERECKEAEAKVEMLNKLAKRLKTMILLVKLKKFVAALVALLLMIMIFVQPERTAFIILGTLLMSWACLNWLTSMDPK